METNKGLLVNVLRSAVHGDGTNNGVSSKHNLFVIVDPDVARIFAATPDCPALKLVRRWFGKRLYIHAEPLVSVPSNCVGYMFGGNYVTSSDSRFRMINEYPIPVHDRIETASDYAAMSM